ncbi:hypothetical protein [Arundinibacter roseus]|uniref:Uncharacterized protein n=1 Tax=Arundinibacter roseus TaxID=2070510 RepID=A0A4R4KFQ2_9BACT|nr:hypothetical protein [Arundinibacter roseus]TDB66824.1 hypothetical protein EZE20_06780 [Arundinibacter roseus]
MVNHLMNVRVQTQKLPKAVFRVVNTTPLPRRGEVMVRLKRVNQETITRRVTPDLVQPGRAWLFVFDIPEEMDNFFIFEWWWVTDDDELSGKGGNSNLKKSFKGKITDGSSTD